MNGNRKQSFPTPGGRDGDDPCRFKCEALIPAGDPRHPRAGAHDRGDAMGTGDTRVPLAVREQERGGVGRGERQGTKERYQMKVGSFPSGKRVQFLLGNMENQKIQKKSRDTNQDSITQPSLKNIGSKYSCKPSHD